MSQALIDGVNRNVFKMDYVIVDGRKVEVRRHKDSSGNIRYFKVMTDAVAERISGRNWFTVKKPWFYKLRASIKIKELRNLVR